MRKKRSIVFVFRVTKRAKVFMGVFRLIGGLGLFLSVVFSCFYCCGSKRGGRIPLRRHGVVCALGFPVAARRQAYYACMMMGDWESRSRWEKSKARGKEKSHWFTVRAFL